MTKPVLKEYIFPLLFIYQSIHLSQTNHKKLQRQKDLNFHTFDCVKICFSFSIHRVSQSDILFYTDCILVEENSFEDSVPSLRSDLFSTL